MGTSESAAEEQKVSCESNDETEDVPLTPSRRGRRSSTRDASSADEAETPATSQVVGGPSPVQEESNPIEDEPGPTAQTELLEDSVPPSHAEDQVQPDDAPPSNEPEAKEEDSAARHEDSEQVVNDEESSESKSSSEQQDSIPEQVTLNQEEDEPQPAAVSEEDKSNPSDEDSKPSDEESKPFPSDLVGDSESSSYDFRVDPTQPTEQDEEILLRGDAELSQPEHEAADIKMEPPDSEQVKLEPGASQDEVEVKEEQPDGGRRSRKSRFTDNDDPVQSGGDVKEEPMDTDATGDSSQVKSESSNDRKRRRSSSRSPRRSRSPQMKRQDDEPEIDESAVLLSWYDSDLNLVIEKDNFLSATPMHQQGFGYIWAGARASFGFSKGKVCYEVKCVENCDVTHLEDEPNPHVLRVGWSVQGTSMQLGMCILSCLLKLSLM